MPMPSMRAKFSIRRSASGSPRLGGGDELAARTACRPAPSRPASGAVGLVRGQLGGVALERLAGAVGLEAAAVRAVARAGRAVRVDGHVAELGAEAVRAAEGEAVDHHAAAHARAEREHHEVALADDVRLGERGAVGVVVHEHRARRSGGRAPRAAGRR